MNKEWLKQAVTSVKQWHTHYVVADWFIKQTALSANELDDRLNEAEAYKHDRTTTVAKLDLGGSFVVLKRYNPRSFGHKVKRALRRSRSHRCWQMSYLFAASGLNVAAPIFMLEKRVLVIRKDAYFANEYLHGDELLKVLPGMGKEQRLHVVRALRHAMDIMQENKLSHGDMKASNLLWVNEELYFIDLDASRQHRFQFSWLRANRRDRKRFLKNWRDMPDLYNLFLWLE